MYGILRVEGLDVDEGRGKVVNDDEASLTRQAQTREAADVTTERRQIPLVLSISCQSAGCQLSNRISGQVLLKA
jgi:hypothetical protein